jgi:hypothetical protein
MLLVVAVLAAVCVTVVVAFLLAVALHTRRGERVAPPPSPSQDLGVTLAYAAPRRPGSNKRLKAALLVAVLALGAGIFAWRIASTDPTQSATASSTNAGRPAFPEGSWIVVHGGLDVGPNGATALSARNRGGLWRGGLVVRPGEPPPAGMPQSQYSVQLSGLHGAGHYHAVLTGNGLRFHANVGALSFRLYRRSARRLVLDAVEGRSAAQHIQIVLRPIRNLPLLKPRIDPAAYVGDWALDGTLRIPAGGSQADALLGEDVRPSSAGARLGGLSISPSHSAASAPNGCKAVFVSADGSRFGPFPAAAFADGLFIGLRSARFSFADGILRLSRQPDGTMTLVAFPPTGQPSPARVVHKVARLATR